MKLCGTKLNHCVVWCWSKKTSSLRLATDCLRGWMWLAVLGVCIWFLSLLTPIWSSQNLRIWRPGCELPGNIIAQSQMQFLCSGNCKVHEEIWASTGSRSCVIPRTPDATTQCLGKGAVSAVIRHFPRSVHCTSSWCKGLTTATPEGASLGHLSQCHLTLCLRENG